MALPDADTLDLFYPERKGQSGTEGTETPLTGLGELNLADAWRVLFVSDQSQPSLSDGGGMLSINGVQIAWPSIPNLLAADHPYRCRLRKVRRVIANEAAMRLLYIPQKMHQDLSLNDMYPRRTSGRRAEACTVTFVTAEGKSCHVTMLKARSKGHLHRRFSTGWREFCSLAGVGVGDELTFVRGRQPNELHVQISVRKTSP